MTTPPTTPPTTATRTTATTAAKITTFAASLGALVALVIGAPAVLMWAARRRFGGASPLHGVPSPADWRLGTIVDALTERLSEDTIADIVIRSSLVIAWAALAVFLATVVAEAVHLVRYEGIARPAVRGLGISQHAARLLAAGLLVVVPALSQPGRAVARGDASLLHAQREASEQTVAAPPSAGLFGESHGMLASHVVRHTPAPIAGSDSSVAATAPVAPASDRYVVRSGDSIYAIATRLAGPDPVAIAGFADQLIDLNLGREMGDGQRFTNAAFIDVGWELLLPTLDGSATASSRATLGAGHLVTLGESLWSIADDELGDGARWPELYDLNEGRTFDDGRTLDDPSLIQPGWHLQMPGDDVIDGAIDDVIEVPIAPAVEPLGEAAVALTAPAEAPTPALPSPTASTEIVQAQPTNVWFERQASATDPSASAPSPAGADAAASAERAGEASSSWSLASPSRAAMLAGGVLTLLAMRRRQALRRARPRALALAPSEHQAATERALRAVGSSERLARLDVAIRAAAPAMSAAGQRLVAAIGASDGAIELVASGRCRLPAPWTGDDARWQLAAATPIELLAADARHTGYPCPLLVQLGVDASGAEVYVDLEALEALEIGGSPAERDAIVAAIAATLAASIHAEVAMLLSVGIPADAFFEHRLWRQCADVDEALAAAHRAVGATRAMAASTFELRGRGTSGEVWEPVAVLVGARPEAIRPPADRKAIALVSGAPIAGPSSRLAPEDAGWVLRPVGLTFTPVGLVPADISALAELVAVPATASTPMVLGGDDPDRTIYPDEAGVLTDPMWLRSPPIVHDDVIYGADPTHAPQEAVHAAEAAEPRDDGLPDGLTDDGQPDDRRPGAAHRFVVRLLGPVEVTTAHGEVVELERSKTRELIAWLATHRDRPTRSGARTALWEYDVRDATFANVVSEARRALARTIEPPEGEEWIGRTMTDALPLHHGVVSDAELVERALAAARLQPPAQAIVTLAPAVDWVTGVPFEGTAYLWPDAEGLTSNLVLLATTATAELAAHHLSLGDVEGVFSATARGLRVLPGHEELIGLRMRAHARAGDLAGVRDEWERYERVINADPWSDGEPSPKLVGLRQELLNPSR